jgi:hypothetical protein
VGVVLKKITDCPDGEANRQEDSKNKHAEHHAAKAGAKQSTPPGLFARSKPAARAKKIGRIARIRIGVAEGIAESFIVGHKVGIDRTGLAAACSGRAQVRVGFRVTVQLFSLKVRRKSSRLPACGDAPAAPLRSTPWSAGGRFFWIQFCHARARS